jgi:hypothetical protein
MSKDEFHSELRQFLNHQPFNPFTVEMRDGRRLAVMKPQVVFCDGAASFIDPEDGSLVDFFHDEVQQIRELEQGAPA